MLSEETKANVESWANTLISAAKLLQKDVGKDKLHAYTIYGDRENGVHITLDSFFLLCKTFNTDIHINKRDYAEGCPVYPYEIFTDVSDVRFHAILTEEEYKANGFKAE